MAKEPLRIVLTGASRGVGLAMAEGFIAAGQVVAGCTRSGEACERLTQRWPSPHRFDVVDVADDAEVAAWAKTVLEAFGLPDLLVNNAGLINRNAPLWEVPADEFSQVI